MLSSCIAGIQTGTFGYVSDSLTLSERSNITVIVLMDHALLRMPPCTRNLDCKHVVWPWAVCSLCYDSSDRGDSVGGVVGAFGGGGGESGGGGG